MSDPQPPKRRGRPPAAPEDQRKVRAIRLSDAHWSMLQSLGVAAWLEPRLERAARAQDRPAKARKAVAATTVPARS